MRWEKIFFHLHGNVLDTKSLLVVNVSKNLLNYYSSKYMIDLDASTKFGREIKMFFLEIIQVNFQVCTLSFKHSLTPSKICSLYQAGNAFRPHMQAKCYPISPSLMKFEVQTCHPTPPQLDLPLTDSYISTKS